jgi:adenosylcobinamide kinase/adenosylcobinamide-phosphate guanylyltransferase
MARIILITGAVRSGKSGFALKLARQVKGGRTFIATATPFDKEMRARISKHRKERGRDFNTIEEPLDLPSALKRVRRGTKAVVLDCVTIWLGNLYHAYGENQTRVRKAVEALMIAVKRTTYTLFIVTNEVGWSIVPENALARKFRDMSGHMNRKLAEVSDRVHLCVCGIPVKIK